MARLVSRPNKLRPPATWCSSRGVEAGEGGRRWGGIGKADRRTRAQRVRIQAMTGCGIIATAMHAGQRMRGAKSGGWVHAMLAASGRASALGRSMRAVLGRLAEVAARRMTRRGCRRQPWADGHAGVQTRRGGMLQGEGVGRGEPMAQRCMVVGSHGLAAGGRCAHGAPILHVPRSCGRPMHGHGLAAAGRGAHMAACVCVCMCMALSPPRRAVGGQALARRGAVQAAAA